MASRRSGFNPLAPPTNAERRGAAAGEAERVRMNQEIAEMGGLPGYNNNMNIGEWGGAAPGGGGGGAPYIPPQHYGYVGHRNVFSMARPNRSLSLAAERAPIGAGGPVGPLETFFSLPPTTADHSVARLVGQSVTNVRRANASLPPQVAAPMMAAAVAAASKPKAPARKPKAAPAPGGGGGGGGAENVLSAAGKADADNIVANLIEGANTNNPINFGRYYAAQKGAINKYEKGSAVRNYLINVIREIAGNYSGVIQALLLGVAKEVLTKATV